MELENKICAFLKNKPGGARALDIAKNVGKTTAKDVNPHLYTLQKKGKLQKIEDNPPLWSLSDLSDPGSKQPKGPKGPEDLQPKSSKNGVKSPSLSSSSRDSSSASETYETRSGQEDNVATALRGLEDFDVEEILGEGGFGCVVKAKHKVDGNHYAIKIVEYLGDKERKEVEFLAKFKHPHIVQYHTSWFGPGFKYEGMNESSGASYESDVEETDSLYSPGESEDYPDLPTQQLLANAERCLYIKMELCEGGTLLSWIDNDQVANREEQAMGIFKQIVDGVEYIHSKGFMHRDLKPENIFFTSDKSIKIGDFNLVTAILDKNGQHIQRTKSRGTAPYRSPEQENTQDYSNKTDIFPLGLIFFELLWKLGSKMERAKIWDGIRHQRFPGDFEKTYKSACELIRSMLEEKPQNRPSAKMIKSRLKRIEDPSRREHRTR